jgi:hypothetical protein
MINVLLRDKRGEDHVKMEAEIRIRSMLALCQKSRNVSSTRAGKLENSKQILP